jgi:hypothetical protein
MPSGRGRILQFPAATVETQCDRGAARDGAASRLAKLHERSMLLGFKPPRSSRLRWLADASSSLSSTCRLEALRAAGVPARILQGRSSHGRLV